MTRPIRLLLRDEHANARRLTRRGGAIFGLALLMLQGAAAAWGQEPPRRSGVQREVVVQLAYALGEAHALHRLCAGPGDATWYARMERLEAQEASDDAGRHQLVDAFNAGFAARQAEALTCGRRSRAAEKAVAARGAGLARRLAAAEADPS